ncbi:MAG: hypothetical protein F6K50_26395 [Moorea sp. SIO3I7]|nr:hypothetical protein [Moorena sp. SIO3I6]NEN98905.1 hypothetical protein [Moorena sp. SIO3I7]NEP25371.1 hypothetical protein [Moorena sp. SIO3I6]
MLLTGFFITIRYTGFFPDSRFPNPSWEGLGVGSDSRFPIPDSLSYS